jgi:hypothetical protein
LLSREDALAELARRYLAAYAPATLDDFASWAGLPMPDLRTGWQRITAETDAETGAESVAVNAAGEPAAMLHTQADRTDDSPDSPQVKLIPRFDAYLLGYRSRDLSVAPHYAKRIHPGGGILNAALLVDGCAVGTWRMRTQHAKAQGERLEVIVEPFELPTHAVRAALEEEAADVGRFLDLEATLVIRKKA